MTDFDLKKYLAQVSHMDVEEIKDTVLNGATVGAGLEEYLTETHNAGAQIIQQYITGDELSHLLAMVAGISTGKILGANDFSSEEKAFLLEIMAVHTEFLRALTLSIMCSTAGIVNKEEWR